MGTPHPQVHLPAGWDAMTDNCIVMLLEKGWVRDFFSKVKSKGKAILKNMDLSFINEMYQDIKDTNRGRPPDYHPEEKLKGVLYCLESGVRKIHGMSRKLKETLAMLICGFQDGTPSAPTISRFFHFLSSVIDKVFQHLAAFAARLGIYENTFLIDKTSIEVFEDDPDAKWNYDATSKSWYYGYGLEIIVDWKTHLPVAGVFINGKHVGDRDLEERLNRKYEIVSPNVFVGDGEFKKKNTHNILLKRRTFPVMKYNPRNAKKSISFSFRIEEIVNETANVYVNLNSNLLKKEYKKENRS